MNGTLDRDSVIQTVNDTLKRLLVNTSYTLIPDTVQSPESITFYLSVYPEEGEEVQIDSELFQQSIENGLEDADPDGIYVVTVTQKSDESAANETPFGFEKIEEITYGIYAVLLFLIFCSFMDSKWVRINHYHNVGALVIGSVQLMDVVYDCLFSIKISLDYSFESSASSSLLVLLWLSVGFIVLPVLVTLVQLYFEMKEWRRYSDELQQWLKQNTTLLYMVSAVTGSSFVAVRVCSSNFFNLKQFALPINEMQKAMFVTKRLYSSVLMEVKFLFFKTEKL